MARLSQRNPDLIIWGLSATLGSQGLDIERLSNALDKMAAHRLDFQLLKHPSPFAFQLMVERFREQLSTEKLSDRIARMLASLGKTTGAVEVGIAPTNNNAIASPSISDRIDFGRGEHAVVSSGASAKGKKHARKVSKPLPLL